MLADENRFDGIMLPVGGVKLGNGIYTTVT